MLARFDAKRAAKLATPDKILSDRPSFNRVVIAGAVSAKDVAGAAANPHVQPVALPVFVAEKDVPTLAAVARDRKANEAARFGAIEGLGVMAAEPAEKVLVEIGTAKDDDKELRKAAWRALLAPYYAEFGLAGDAGGGGPARMPFDETSCALVEDFAA